MTASDAELLERLKLKEPRKQTDQLRKWCCKGHSSVCSVESDRKSNGLEGMGTRINLFHCVIGGKNKKRENKKEKAQ